MKRIVLYMFLAILVVTGLGYPCLARGKNITHEKILVYISLLDYYVMQDKTGELYGPGVEFWKGIIAHADEQVDYEYKLVSFSEKLEAVKSGKGIGVGGISMTAEREKFLNFGTPTNKVGQLIAVRKKMKEINYPLLVLTRLSTWTNCYFFLVVVLIVRVFALMLWAIERHNPTIPRKFGLLAPIEESGFYISQLIVWESMTTIGRGKYTPGTRPGYAITKMSWCLGAVILSYMVGILTTAMFTGTQAELDSLIHSASDLSGRVVATKKDTFSVSAAEAMGATVVHENCKNFQAAFDLLENDEVNGVVGDSPVILSYVKNHSEKFVVVGRSFENKFYAPAYPPNWDDLREAINRATLKFYEDKDNGYSRIYSKWFGNN